MATGTPTIPPGSCVAGFLSEMQSIQAFIDAQSKVTDVQPLQQAQCDSLVKRLGLLEKMDVASATCITTIIHAGPWTPVQKDALANALQNRLSAGALCSPEATVKGRRRNQHCTNFERYLTNAEISLIQDNTIGLSDATYACTTFLLPVV